MREAIKNMVLDLLNNYQENQRRIALLRYEMEHPAHVTAEEMIDALSFGHTNALGVSSGHISNKTLYIALNYQEKTERANAGILDEIAVRLNELERQQERLNRYISLMDNEEAEIIRLTYFERLASEEIAEKLHIHPRTVYKRRVKAIDNLCEMYAFAANIQGDAGAE